MGTALVRTWSTFGLTEFGSGEHEVEAKKDFRLEYLIPFRKTCSRIFEVKIRCDQVLQPGSSPDIRVLGVMIFSLELV